MTTVFHTSHPQLCSALRRDRRWVQVSAVLYGAQQAEAASMQRTMAKVASRPRLRLGYGGHFRAVQGFRYIGEAVVTISTLMTDRQDFGTAAAGIGRRASGAICGSTILAAASRRALRPLRRPPGRRPARRIAASSACPRPTGAASRRNSHENRTTASVDRAAQGRGHPSLLPREDPAGFRPADPAQVPAGLTGKAAEIFARWSRSCGRRASWTRPTPRSSPRPPCTSP